LSSFVLSIWFFSAGSLLLLLSSVQYYRSPRCPLVVYPCFFTTACSVCIFCIIYSCYFLPLHFVFSLPHSVLASLTDQHATRHHTIPLANSTLTSTVPVLPPPCCLRAHAPFASLSCFVCSSVRRTTVYRMLSGCRPISAGCRSSVSGGRGRFQPAPQLTSGQRQCCDIRRRIESQFEFE